MFKIIIIKIIMLRNNLVVLVPRLMVIYAKIKNDKLEIENRMRNTYYNKIIGVIRINNDEKNLKE